MIRQKIASALLAALEYRQRNPAKGIFLSLLVLAASVTGIYFILRSSSLSLPCMTDMCGR